MRRILLLLLLLAALAGPTVAAESDGSALEARAWLLMDATTGRVLIQHEGDTPLPMASTTKIMTAILAIERGNLADLVTVGQKPYETGESTIYLEIGEQQRLEDLLYALLLESANDAGVAIAEHLAGTEERFAEWMNEKAQALGATRTHFVNSHGLHDPDHYASAHDLALIARYAMQNEIFRQMVVAEEREIPGPPGQPPRRLVNRNRLLGYYPGANGVKNGFTEEADLTNVASARQGETELIAVVLGAKVKLWTSSMALLDFGFERYETRWAARKGVVLIPEQGRGKILARIDEDLRLTVEKGSPGLVQQIEWAPDLDLPVAEGTPVGWLQILQGGKEVGRVPLVAAGLPADSRRPDRRGPVSQTEPGQAVLWIVAWLGASLALTLQLHRLRMPEESGGAKEE